MEELKCLSITEKKEQLAVIISLYLIYPFLQPITHPPASTVFIFQPKTVINHLMMT